MKKLTVLFSVLAFSLVSMAQEDANFYKAEGNAAYQEKNYEMAFVSYAKSLEIQEQSDVVDTPLYYNAAYCAYKAKKYEEAIPYFEKAIELKYKKTKPIQYLISIELKLNDVDKAIDIALNGLEMYPDDKKLKNLTATVYLKKGLLFYNDGNKIKKAANESGLNETDPEAFKAEYAKADAEYSKALPFMEKAYEYNPESDKVVKALKNVYISLDMTDKADAL